MAFEETAVEAMIGGVWVRDVSADEKDATVYGSSLAVMKYA